MNGAVTHYENGLAAKSVGEYPRAIGELQLAIEIDPHHAESHQELGWLTYGTGGELLHAREHLETAIRINPELGDAHMYLGIVLNRLSRHQESELCFRMALTLSADPALVHSTFAEEFLWHNGRYGEAEEHFLTALRLSPDSVLALLDYARMLTCHGRDSEAKRLFVRALDIDPDDSHTKRAYGEFVRETVSEARDANECLRAAIHKDPRYVEGIAILNSRTP